MKSAKIIGDIKNQIIKVEESQLVIYMIILNLIIRL